MACCLSSFHCPCWLGALLLPPHYLSESTRDNRQSEVFGLTITASNTVALALELSISCRPQERLQAAAVTFLKLEAYGSCGLHKYVRAVNTTASLHHSRSRFRSVPDRTVAQPLSLVALPIDRPMNGVLRRISCRRMSRGGGRGPSRVMTKSIAAMLGGRSFGVRQACYSYVLDAPAPRARVLAGVDTEWS